MKRLAPSAFLLLAACNLAPDYHRPSMPDAPESYKEMNGWKTAEPSDAKPRGPWWEAYGDPELNVLERKLDAANQTIAAALASYDGARAAAEYARAEYFPSISGSGSAEKEKLSKNSPVARGKNRYNNYTLQADLSYEVDLWGRVRNAVRAAGAEAEATQADLASVKLSLEAELATDFFSLRADDAEQQILDQTVVAYDKALGLTIRRHDGGIASASDVAQAQVQLETAKTEAADMRLRRGQLEHAIGMLTGQSASTFVLAPGPLKAHLPDIDPGQPSKLLERRPDIAAAERTVAAANHEIGVARAAWFPALTLGTAGGVESAAVDQLLKSPSLFWSFGPSVSLPIFEGGRIAALNAEARHAYDARVANYRQTVLGATRDVEDAILALQKLGQENQSQTAAAQAANTLAFQSQQRYIGGVVTYLEVVSSQDASLNAQLRVIDIQARQYVASVALAKALGGGWQGLKPLSLPAMAVVKNPAS